MGLATTLAAAAAALIATVIFGWLGARPTTPSLRPRIVPWRLLMTLAFTLMVAMLVHAANLARGG